MSLMRAVATVSGLTLISRVAGFARDILTAAILGAGPVADAFFVALKLPNLFRRLFAEGAFSVAFVPLFSAELEREGHDRAVAFAQNTLAVMISVLLPLTILAVVFMPTLITVIAPGFVDDPERFDQAVTYSRITFPYLMLMSLVALMGGVLNALERYAPFAAAPILFNLCLIAALLWLDQVMPTTGHALAVGVLTAGILQLIWLAVACKRAGVEFRLPRPRLTPRIRRLFRLMTPGALGAGVMQINAFIDVVLASLLPTGAISFLYYADRLYQLPLGVIGIAIGTAMLPILSRQVEAGETARAQATQSRALDLAMLLSIPAAVALIAVPAPILAALFERGAFGPEDTQQTAYALAAYAIGIPAYVMVKVFSTGYFARQDTATPVKIAILCTIINVALSLILIQFIAHVGIALATGLTAWLNATLLALGLRRRGLFTLDRATGRRIAGQLGAGAGLGLCLKGAGLALAPLFVLGGLHQTLALLGLVLVGALVYFGLARLTGGFAVKDLTTLLRKKPA